METPYNENLLLSSGLGLNGVFGGGQLLQPGVRNQGEFGIQQGFGRWVVVDFGYFVKHTQNGYDFNVLFNTPIVFPVAWDHSQIDGFTGRLNLVAHNGFSAFVVMAHTNAIFSPPAAGGILLEAPPGDFRIDHDQKFNATTNLQYTFEQAGWRRGRRSSWRYDSGLVAGSVPDLADGAGADRRSTGGDRPVVRQHVSATPTRAADQRCSSIGDEPHARRRHH